MPVNPGSRYPKKSKVEVAVETTKNARTLVGGVCAVLGVISVLTGLVIPGAVAIFLGGWLIGHEK